MADESTTDLPGNPYVQGAVASAGNNALGIEAALLAVAFELRTGNLIAAGDIGNAEVRERLGLPAKKPGSTGFGF